VESIASISATAGSSTVPLIVVAALMVVAGIFLLVSARTRRSKRGRHASGGIKASDIGEVVSADELRGRDSNSQPSG
jgi:hypothetical protein